MLTSEPSRVYGSLPPYYGAADQRECLALLPLQLRSRHRQADLVNPRELANLELLRTCLQNPEESIADLFQAARSLPEGERRNRLLDEVSPLDSIADNMRQASIAFEEK
jgi:hypothetical protein